jgi:hypothetical protein
MESSIVTASKPNDVMCPNLSRTELANQQADSEAVRCLPQGYVLSKTRRGKDCIFCALALSWGVDASTQKEVRKSIVKHLRDWVDVEKKPIPIQTFMKDVHKRCYRWKKYWGDDCKPLLTTLGLNMSVEQLVLPTGLGTFRKVLCGDLLPNVLKFLFGETMKSYRKRILKPMYGRGDNPELVAAGQTWNRHIVVMQPAPSQLKMTQTRFILSELPISQRNTTYLVRVNNNHYHACDFRKDLQVDVDTTARLLLPSGFYVEEMKRDSNCMFRALAHLWNRDSELHRNVRDQSFITLPIVGDNHGGPSNVARRSPRK